MLFITQESDLKLNDGVSATYFYASWLNFHKRILNHLVEAEKAYPQIKFYAVNIDYFHSLIEQYKITSLPYIYLTREREILIERVVGIKETLSFKSLLDDIYQIGDTNAE